MMRKVKIFPVLSLAICLMSCHAQVKPIGEAALQLKGLNFDTDISSLYPDKNKNKQFEGYYDVKSNVQMGMTKVDTVYEDNYSDEKKPKWVEYRAQSSSSEDTNALFDGFPFNTVNVVAGLDHKLMVVNGVAMEVTDQASKKLIAKLDGLYGKHTRADDEFFHKPFQIYTWKLGDRLIKYCTVYDDESNVLKLEVDKDKKTIQSAAKESHVEGFIYIINKTYEKQVVGQMNTGDLIYCK